VLEAMLAPLIVAQTVSQLAAGVTFTPAEVVGPMVGFVVIAGAALWFLIGLLRAPDTAPTGHAGAHQADAVAVGGLR